MHKQSTKLRSVSARTKATFDLTVELTDIPSQELEERKIEGFLYASMLRRPDCPQAFREAFTNIFIEHLWNECGEAVIRDIDFFFPLVVGLLQGWIPADANRTVEILRTLQETLAPKLYQELKEKFESEGLEVDHA